MIGVSQAILDRIQPTGARAIVPNGVAPEEWRQPGASGVVRRASFAENPVHRGIDRRAPRHRCD